MHMACICGGVGEIFLIGLIVSGIGWVVRKVFKKGHKHSASCNHPEVGDGHH